MVGNTIAVCNTTNGGLNSTGFTTIAMVPDNPNRT